MLYVKIDNYWHKIIDKTDPTRAVLSNVKGERIINFNLFEKEIVKAKSWKDLDWEGTKVLDNKYLTGWIDKKGVFYGCDYRCHKEQAVIIHGMKDRQLEKSGFMKITFENAISKQPLALMSYSKPTPEQLDTLRSLDESAYETFVFRKRFIEKENNF